MRVLGLPLLALAVAMLGPGIAAALVVYGSPRAIPGAGGCFRDPPEPPATGQPCAGTAVGLGEAQAVAVSPGGASVYVAAESDVVALARDRVTGELRPALSPSTRACIGVASSSPCTSSDGALAGADALAISRDGRFVYVGAADGATVSAFARGPHGLLTPLARSMRPPGKKAAPFFGCVSGSPLGGAPRSNCAAQADALEGVDALAISPDGRYLYAVSYGLEPGADSIVTLQRNPRTGGLRPLTSRNGCVQSLPGTRDCLDVAGLEGAAAIAITPDGRFLYVASEVSGAVRAFSRNRSTGVLKPVYGHGGCVSSGKYADGDTACAVTRPQLAGARSIALSPDGRELYVAAFDPGAVTVLRRDPSSGRLALGTSGCLQAAPDLACPVAFPALHGAAALALSPDGHTLYVVSEAGNSLIELVRNPVDGTLSLASASPTALDPLAGPAALALSPDGRSIYVASPFGDGLAALSP